MKLRNCIFVSTTMLMSLITSKVAFAGDSLLNLSSKLGDKPNTGDSNTLIIYASIIGVAVIGLILVNCTGKSKNKDVESVEDKVVEKSKLNDLDDNELK